MSPLHCRPSPRCNAGCPGRAWWWSATGRCASALEADFPRALFVGTQRGAALAAHYASADLFLFPSQSETFGNVTLEALASGLVVVAFDSAAAGEHIRDGHNGVLARGDDAGAFIDAADRAARAGAAVAAPARARPRRGAGRALGRRAAPLRPPARAFIAFSDRAERERHVVLA